MAVSSQIDLGLSHGGISDEMALGPMVMGAGVGQSAAMFEVVATICAAALCVTALLPGYEVETLAACEAQLGDIPSQTVAGLEARDPACQAVGKTLPFTQVAPGVHVHRGEIAEWSAQNRGDISNIVIVVGEAAAAVIDTGSARWMGEAIWRSLRALTDLPLRHVIVTHMHPDHALGAEVLQRTGARIVGLARLQRALADRRANYLASLEQILGPRIALGTDVPKVDIAVADELTLDLGGRALTVTAWPPAHTGADLTVVDSATNLLIAGDLLFDTHVPALDGALTGWQDVMADLTERRFAGVVPGHGAVRLDWPAGAAPQTAYLNILAEDTRAAIARGDRLGDAIHTIAQGQSDDWALFEVFNLRNATVAFTELEWE